MRRLGYLRSLKAKRKLMSCVQPTLMTYSDIFSRVLSLLVVCYRSLRPTAAGLHQRRSAMSDLVVISFPTEAKAEEVRQKLLAMQKEYLIELGDAVIAVKDDKGRIKLNQLLNTTTAGDVSGKFWGTLIGLIFLMLTCGASMGA